MQTTWNAQSHDIINSAYIRTHSHNELMTTCPFSYGYESYLRRASESGLEVEHAVRVHSGGALASSGARQQQLRGGGGGDRNVVRLLARALVHLAHYAVHCGRSGGLQKKDWRRPESVRRKNVSSQQWRSAKGEEQLWRGATGLSNEQRAAASNMCRSDPPF